jgi:hypothetical protein
MGAAGFPAQYGVRSAALVNVVRNSDSVWGLADHYHWILQSPRWLANPVPWKGHLG